MTASAPAGHPSPTPEAEANAEANGGRSQRRSPLTVEANGDVSWQHEPGDTYVVTGVDRAGRRWRREFASWHHARCMNPWRGTFWLVRNGQRFAISRVYN